VNAIVVEYAGNYEHVSIRERAESASRLVQERIEAGEPEVAEGIERYRDALQERIRGWN
jgi:hypothetical protein